MFIKCWSSGYLCLLCLTPHPRITQHQRNTRELYGSEQPISVLSYLQTSVPWGWRAELFVFQRGNLSQSLRKVRWQTQVLMRSDSACLQRDGGWKEMHLKAAVTLSGHRGASGPLRWTESNLRGLGPDVKLHSVSACLLIPSHVVTRKTPWFHLG